MSRTMFTISGPFVKFREIWHEKLGIAGRYFESFLFLTCPDGKRKKPLKIRSLQASRWSLDLGPRKAQGRSYETPDDGGSTEGTREEHSAADGKKRIP